MVDFPKPPHLSGPPLFPLGRILSTPGALLTMQRLGVWPATLLARHERGDFGTLDAEDIAANVLAIKNGERILSSYPIGNVDAGVKIWIITEADRASTTMLLPEEY